MAPPDYVIEAARLAAVQSPCAKSKRGVALFNPELHDDSVRAWERASTYAVTHADILQFRATRVIVASGFNGPPRGFSCTNSMVCRGSCRDVCMHAEQRALIIAVGCDVGDLEIVHVKVVDEQVVAGGGPSCLQCSRFVADVRIRGVWLFERMFSHDHDDGSPSSKPVELAPEWRFYDSMSFHRATLVNSGIASLGVVDGRGP